MEEETDLEADCGTRHSCTDNFNYKETKTSGANFTLDPEGATETPKGLDFSPCSSTVTAGLKADHVSVSGAEADVLSAARIHTNNITGRLEADVDDRGLTNETTDTEEDVLCLTGQDKCGASGFVDDISHLFSSFALKDSDANARESSKDHSSVLAAVENAFNVDFTMKTCSSDGSTDTKRMDSHWGKFVLNHQVISLFSECISDLISVILGGC